MDTDKFKDGWQPGGPDVPLPKGSTKMMTVTVWSSGEGEDGKLTTSLERSDELMAMPDSESDKMVIFLIMALGRLDRKIALTGVVMLAKALGAEVRMGKVELPEPFHVSPGRDITSAGCETCDAEDCPDRVRPYQGRPPFPGKDYKMN